MFKHMNPDGQPDPLHAFSQMKGFDVAPVAPQLPPRHSWPEVASPVATQQAPVGLVPWTYWSAGTQAVVGLGGSQNP
jgi:hypothetical protein